MKQIVLILILIFIAAAAGCSIADEPQEPDPASPSLTVSDAPSPTTSPIPSPTPAAFAIELGELPEEYLPEDAAANGDYVEIHGKQYYNEEKLTSFLDAVAAEENAAIRVVCYTDEGDPIITDVIYNGSEFTGTADNTRDQYGIKQILNFEFKNILNYELEDGRIFIVLTDESEVTKDMMEVGFDGYILTVIN